MSGGSERKNKQTNKSVFKSLESINMTVFGKGRLLLYLNYGDEFILELEWFLNKWHLFLRGTEDAIQEHRESDVKTRGSDGSEARSLQKKAAPSGGHNPADELTFSLWSVELWWNKLLLF